MSPAKPGSADQLARFLHSAKPDLAAGTLTAVSLYSGAGLSDAGYAAAGFRFVVHVELDKHRAALGANNFSDSSWLVGDVTKNAEKIRRCYAERTQRRLDLLVATPPCQGMSSSNPSRGKRGTKSAAENEAKNRLILGLVQVARRLLPRVIVAENVRQMLTHTVRFRGRQTRVLDRLRARLSNYTFFEAVINVADYGVPQDRRRAVVVGIANDEPSLARILDANRLPWPMTTHAAKKEDAKDAWISVSNWLKNGGYAPLDARSAVAASNGHPLHKVPHYEDERYLWVSSIPPNSGRSAYENDVCPECKSSKIAVGRIRCPHCNAILRNRPFVRCPGGARLVRGFDSSYRRMPANLPARTITTNTSHLGSDHKIHPWENRVLSALECADLQTIPRWYSWSSALEARRAYLVRNVIGEAFPAYFTFLHGQVLKSLLMGDRTEADATLPQLATDQERR